MLPFDCAETVAEHDRGEHATVRFYGVLAAVLWFLSWLVALLVLRFVVESWPVGLRHAVVWLWLAVLVWQGFRFAAAQTRREQALAAVLKGDVAADALSRADQPGLAQRSLAILAAAPHLSVLAWRARSAALAWDEERCRRGQALFQRLGEHREWLALGELSSAADLLPGMARMELIDWQVGASGVVEVRLRPELVKRYFTKKDRDPFATMMASGHPPDDGG